MKRERTIDLRDASLVSTPTLKAGTTSADYLLALRAVTGANKKHAASLNVFERWLGREGLTRELKMDEDLLGRFRSAIQAGRLRTQTGRRYRSMERQVPSDIFTLHNAAVNPDGVVIRRLIDTRQYDRLKFIAGLTEVTRKALVWFHEKAACTASKHGRPQLMTQATRDGALVALLALLRRLDVRGLELVTSEHIAGLLPDPDDDDPQYRRAVHTLREASTVYRACCKEGLLTSNPLSDVPHSTFTDRAQRDFLPPAEVDRVRDLRTVDMGNWLQVRDRLVMLMLIDTAMRKSELAAVLTHNVRVMPDGSYQVTLPPEAQKMRGKVTAHLGIIYPETGKLLKHYLEDIRPRYRGVALIVDNDGHDGSPQVVYRSVGREGARLGLRCYHSSEPPGCHDLRRTFATVNAAPLGLKLTASELADRMRAGYDVVNRHYVLRNPLRSAMTDAEYRKRIVMDPAEEAATHVEALVRLGISVDVLAPVRSQVEAMRPHTVETPPAAAPVVWIPETDALELLRASWKTVPPLRSMRPFWRAEKIATQRVGLGGRLHLDRFAVQALASEYVPVSAVVSRGQLVVRAVAEKYTAKMVGRVRLIKRIDALEFIKDSEVGPTGNPARLANCKTGAAQTVKQPPKQRTEVVLEVAK